MKSRLINDGLMIYVTNTIMNLTFQNKYLYKNTARSQDARYKIISHRISTIAHFIVRHDMVACLGVNED